MSKHTITISVYLILMVSLLLLSNIAHAQSNVDSHNITISINEIALIDLNNDDAMTFAVLPPLLAGNIPRITPQYSISKRLFYTSIIPSLGSTRKVTVKSDPKLPDGIKLEIAAIPPLLGMGNCGQSTGYINLSTTEQDILYNIGSCWTGRIIGSILIYKASIDETSFASIFNQTATVSVVYTLTDK